MSVHEYDIHAHVYGSHCQCSPHLLLWWKLKLLIRPIQPPEHPGPKRLQKLHPNGFLIKVSNQGSDQFMNWIGIDNQFNSIQHELNWNWIERFWIGIELELKTWTDRNWSIQSIHFEFNSSFYKVKHFLYAILWKLQCDKQPHVSKHTRMLHCVFPVWGVQGSLDIKGWPLHQLFWDISSALTH